MTEPSAEAHDPVPTVSMVVPVYNGARFVEETVASILAQTFGDFELILIDDGSTDDSVEVLCRFDDPRIRLHRNLENLGIPLTMNRALGLARGRYLARCDHDDICDPERFALQVAFLDANPGVTILGTAVELFGAINDVVAAPEDDATVKAHFCWAANNIINPTMMMRRDFIVASGVRYDASLHVADDYGFYIDCLKAGATFANLPQALLRQRIHLGSLSQQHSRQTDRSIARVRARVFRAYFPTLTNAETDRLVAMCNRTHPGTLDHLIETARVVDKALAAQDGRRGQNIIGVDFALRTYLRLMAQTYCDNGLFRPEQMAMVASLFSAETARYMDVWTG